MTRVAFGRFPGACPLAAVLALALMLTAAAGRVGAALPPPSAPTLPALPAVPLAPALPAAAAAGAVPAPAGRSGSAAAPASLTPAGAGGRGGVAAAATLVEAALARLPTEHLDSVLRTLSVAGGVPLPSLGATVADLLHGRLPLTPTTVLALAERDLGRELTVQASLLGRLIVLAVGAGLLDLLGRALGRQEAARLGATVVHLALVAMALGSFTLAFALARTIVADLDSLMEAILPLMIGLLAAMGAVTSAALFQPLMFGAVELIGSAVASVALPLLYVAGVLDVVGRITPYRLEAVAGLLRTVGLWVLGAVLTAFLGVVVVAGSLGPVTDGLALKAGKFLANALIPVVGKMFADATEMVMGTSLVLKNAVGAAGLVALLLLLVLPVMKLLALSFTYRLAGSAVAPVGAGPVPDVLASMAGTLLFVAVAVGAMAMMCFIAMAALLSAGSAGVLP